VVNNKELVQLNNVEVLAIIYNTENLPMASSETFIDSIDAREKKQVRFIWPYFFTQKVGRIEFFVRVPLQE